MNLNLVAHATRSSLDRLYEVLDGASSNPARVTAVIESACRAACEYLPRWIPC